MHVLRGHPHGCPRNKPSRLGYGVDEIRRADPSFCHVHQVDDAQGGGATHSDPTGLPHLAGSAVADICVAPMLTINPATVQISHRSTLGPSTVSKLRIWANGQGHREG